MSADDSTRKWCVHRSRRESGAGNDANVIKFRATGVIETEFAGKALTAESFKNSSGGT
jgi:hypothetical protein